MTLLPTEGVGSIPRSRELQEAIVAFSQGNLPLNQMNQFFDHAVEETIRNLEATGSPIISDGEQTKTSFVTYPLDNLKNLASDGISIPFEDGHTRQLPRLTNGPFHYSMYAGSYLPRAKKYANRPLKQAVISASAMSLLYPQDGLPHYSQDQFLSDLIKESVADIRSCFDNGAVHVQVDFTEARLSLKLDPSKGLLQRFIDLNNQVLSHFSEQERQHIGFHTCPGGDHDSTHSADVDYPELIPLFLTLNSGNFYMQMASEKDPIKSLKIVGENIRPNQRVYVGVIDVINEEVESPETVCDRIMTAAEYIPVHQLGTTDDCGFSPFSDDIATSRATAFAKIAARIEGTKMASEKLKLGA
ncbi:5-methyltetrahydropteroyltriglutamate--homocysteine methyltransferase [Marinilongibacter aquaticus]|uniref:5-methyltetrahydropteroyltriglutamate-- homocysteine methyltransferase n=1 Tax=Marinilongibacter aquaticus TaxID=2975157 RepID=UPI0021BD2BB0|nr:5-methyltetrahydropteroyltriglutamate--homocysteine methyltransferase [Marinilongibacter aquaticus]UBM58792.1 5-methyltetrahydropteroyltriglutamate--homocysteine methyltransferase [Marinilongibacter aquaticus]